MEEKKELISVIVPVYNAERYLCRCIDSIVNQSYDKLEIILVDDGSTDSSGKLCDELQKKDSRIQVIHKSNGGASTARNAGVKHCIGEWIAFMDSDDFIQCNYIEELYRLCKEYGVMVSQCGAVRGMENSFPEEKVEVSEKKWKFSDMYKSPGREFRAIVWGKLIRAELARKYPFPEGIIFEDEDVAFKYMYEAKECVVTNKHLYYYYMSPNSVMRNQNKRINFEYIGIFEERCAFLKEKNEMELIEYTKKELCIRFLLGYCSAIKEKRHREDIVKIKNFFQDTYRKTDWRLPFPSREKLAIRLFYFFPHLFSFAENSLNIISSSKYRREKR